MIILLIIYTFEEKALGWLIINHIIADKSVCFLYLTNVWNQLLPIVFPSLFKFQPPKIIRLRIKSGFA